LVGVPLVVPFPGGVSGVSSLVFGVVVFDVVACCPIIMISL
jgi:hypothetical protein